MTEAPDVAGAGLRLARQARGFSQQQLAGMAGVSRQAVSAVESGHSDPSLRVALALAQALGMSVEALFGPGEPAAPVEAVSVAPLNEQGAMTRVTLAPVGDRFVALPLRGDAGATFGFLPAGGITLPAAGVIPPATGFAVPAHANGAAAAVDAEQAAPSSGVAPVTGTGAAPPGNESAEPGFTPIVVTVRPIGPPRPTLVVAGCDPALPLLATPLALLDPPVAFAWWPCGSAEALRLARAGLVHVAGFHSSRGARDNSNWRAALPAGAEIVGFTAWREGLAVNPALAGTVTGLDSIAARGLRIVNREPGAEARRLLDAERERLGLAPEDLTGYQTRAAGHLQVVSAVAAGLADAGVASEPAARAYGLCFVPLAQEQFDLLIPAEHAASREAQALLKVLTSPWLLAQLASLPGYDTARCGERLG